MYLSSSPSMGGELRMSWDVRRAFPSPPLPKLGSGGAPGLNLTGSIVTGLVHRNGHENTFGSNIGGIEVCSESGTSATQLMRQKNYTSQLPKIAIRRLSVHRTDSSPDVSASPFGSRILI